MKFTKIVAAIVMVVGASAYAQVGAPVRIGMITDMSSLYTDIDGPAGAEMVKWAV